MLLRVAYPDVPPTRDDAVRLLAGFAAEFRIRAGAGWRPKLRNWRHHCDVKQAVRIVGVDGLQDVWDESVELVAAEWASIVRIALELQQARCLSGEEVARLWRAERAAAGASRSFSLTAKSAGFFRTVMRCSCGRRRSGPASRQSASANAVRQSSLRWRRACRRLSYGGGVAPAMAAQCTRRVPL